MNENHHSIFPFPFPCFCSVATTAFNQLLHVMSSVSCKYNHEFLLHFCSEEEHIKYWAFRSSEDREVLKMYVFGSAWCWFAVRLFITSIHTSSVMLA